MIMMNRILHITVRATAVRRSPNERDNQRRIHMRTQHHGIPSMIMSPTFLRTLHITIVSTIVSDLTPGALRPTLTLESITIRERAIRSQRTHMMDTRVAEQQDIPKAPFPQDMITEARTSILTPKPHPTSIQLQDIYPLRPVLLPREPRCILDRNLLHPWVTTDMLEIVRRVLDFRFTLLLSPKGLGTTRGNEWSTEG